MASVSFPTAKPHLHLVPVSITKMDWSPNVAVTLSDLEYCILLNIFSQIIIMIKVYNKHFIYFLFLSFIGLKDIIVKKNNFFGDKNNKKAPKY